MRTHRLLKLGILLAMSAAHAETNVWVGGGGNGLWSTPDNWTNAVLPVGASDLTLSLAGNLNLGTEATPLNQDIAEPLDVNRLQTEDAPALTDAFIYLAGAGLNFVTNGAIQPTLYHNRDQNIMLRLPIILPAQTTLTVGNRSYQIYLEGPVSGEGVLRFATGGGGELVLQNAANSFSGGVQYVCTGGNNQQWGRLRVTRSNAFGTGPVTLSGGNTTVLGVDGNTQASGLTFQGTTAHTNDFSLTASATMFAGEGLTNESVTAASATLSGAFDLNSYTLTLRGQRNTEGLLSGSLSDSGVSAVTKMDLGRWTLSGANTFTGRVTVSNGTLKLGAEAALLPEVPVTVSGGIYDLNGFIVTNGAVTISGGAISNGTLNAASVTGSNGGAILAGLAGDGGLTKTGAGTLTLSAANTYTSATTVSAGILQFARRASLYGGDTAQWTDANIIVNSGGTLAFSAGGDGEFTVADLDLFNALGTAGGGFLTGSLFGIDTTSAAGGTFSYGAVIGNPGGNARGLAKLGAGALVLADANTYTGPTHINAGVLSVGTLALGGSVSGIGAAASNAVNLVVNGGSLRYTGPSFTTDRLFTFGTGNTASFDVAQAGTTLTFKQFRGVIGRNDNSVIVKNGPGTLSLGNDGIINGGANVYIGNIAAFEINEGRYETVANDMPQLNLVRKAAQGPALILGDGAYMGYGAPFSALNSGDEQVVRYTGTNRMASTYIGSLQGPTTPGYWNTKTFDVNDGASEIDLVVLGNMGVYPTTPSPAISRLRKDGAGTLKLLGTASSYRETTIIRAGRLLIGASVPYNASSVLGLCTNDAVIGDAGTQPSDTPTLLFDGPANSAFTFARGLVTWATNGVSTFGSLSNVNVTLSGPVTVSNTLQMLSVTAGTNALFVTGDIGGPGGVTMSGTGTVLFVAANTYTGATTLAAGTLRLAASERIADASPLRLAGGTLELNGFSETLGTLDVDGAAILDFGSGACTVTLADSAAETWDGTLVLHNLTPGSDQFFVGDSATLSAAQLARITSPTGQAVRQLDTGEVVFVPPGTVFMLQ